MQTCCVIIKFEFNCCAEVIMNSVKLSESAVRGQY